MIVIDTLRAQTLGFRKAIAGMLREDADRADEIPPNWNNNLRWHAGHLIVTPRLLTFGLAGEPLGVPEDYRKWFAKGSGPRGWGNDPVPPFVELVDALVASIETIFQSMNGRMERPFPQPYTTSLGIVLSTPAESLNFSLAHDAMHLGMVMALRRELRASAS